MEQFECCVCHRTVHDDAPRLGTRAYCDLHYRRVSENRKGLWWSTILALVGLVLFVLTVRVVVGTTGLAISRGVLLPIGVVLALVPAALWLVVFYAQDRLEPEPKERVAGVLVLAALLAQAVGIPAVNEVFAFSEWIGSAPVALQVLGSILIVGVPQEYLKYAVVRYGVYRSSEFDERVDGIIYCAAAGLGYATVLNIHYVIATGGAQLQVGILRIVVTTLAQASSSGLMGYFLGRAKFEDMGKLWLPGGLLLASALNGIVTHVLGEVTVRGLTFTPMNGLVLAAVVAVIVFGLVYALMRRANAATLAGL
ncbi:MAG TPA: PrsW family intramembrane metalloprotease [Chloroflexi bacterium]|jgi:RsiW-degrading membrane proteinase PrsW (M82 family)|nr:PrsW family intramembrane metalloprotease [Chloroflexota bacterium]